MIKLFLQLMILQVLLISCTTTVKFQIEHPPLVDLRAVNTITVIPLEWSEFGKYRHLANDVTRALRNGIRSSGIYTFVNSAQLWDVNEADYWEYVDVYITGKIINVTSNDESKTKEETEGDKTVTKTYVTRTVTVEIEYKYIRAINSEVLMVFRKTEKHDVTFDNTETSKSLLVSILLHILFPGPSTETIAKSAIAKFSDNMIREIAPWTTAEERLIAKSKSKDRRFREAQKLVRQKRYAFALVLYKSIYEETGSAVAGFNTALLLQANGQFRDALELLENLDRGISETGIDTPSFVTNEIEKVRELIGEFEVLEDYKNLQNVE